MKKMMFTMEGNLCAARIREGRYRHNPPLTQEDLARKIQFLGNENMTSLIISRIEKNQRHVCDGELLLMIKVHETEFSPVIVKHPFTDSGIAGIQYNGAFKVLNIVGSSHDLSLWLNFMERKIEEADSLFKIFMMVTKPYRLTFLKYIEPYLSRNDFSNILVNAWMSAEYVNQYIDVSKNKLISMFKSANPAIMMDEGEYKQFKNLEDVLTVYRGVTSYNSKSIKVMSWTLSLDTAKWFSNRFGEKGTVYKAHIRKQYVFALLNGRNESEVVVDPEYLTDVIKMQD